MRKVVLAITGASGSIYASLLIRKMMMIRNQWDEFALVLTENAKDVWKTELENESFLETGLPIYSK
ncbi:MAG: hypothetical protein RLY85_2105, partial [Bacteroidota bacterium]